MAGLYPLAVLVCFLGGIQSPSLAQNGLKFSYPRVLERIELLVTSLNETLEKTKEELQEVRFHLNETKTRLGDVQREKESLEELVITTKQELSTTKALHQQMIDELRANHMRDSGRMEALERQGEDREKRLRRLRNKVSDLEDTQVSDRITAIENEQLPRRMNELTRHVNDLMRDLRRLEDENLPRRLNELAVAHSKITTKFVITEFRHNFTITALKRELRQVRREAQILDTKLVAVGSAVSTLQAEQLAARVQELTDKLASLQIKLTEVEVGEELLESRIASSGAMLEVRWSISEITGHLNNLTAVIEQEQYDVENGLAVVKEKIWSVEEKLKQTLQSLTRRLADSEKSYKQSITVLEGGIAETTTVAAQLNVSIGGLKRELRQQRSTATSIGVRVAIWRERLDTLISTVEEQGTYIANLNVAVEEINNGECVH